MRSSSAALSLPHAAPRLITAERTGQRKNLTDRLLKSLKPAPAGKRYDVIDKTIGGFGVRVTDKGKRSFILIARYPGSKNPTRRTLGEYPTMSLLKARQTASLWHGLIADGTDPKDEEERRQREAARKKADGFEAVLANYKKCVLSKQRRGHIVERELRKFFGGMWKDKPITSINRQDVIDVIADKPLYQAHNLFGSVRAMLNWAIESGAYGLEHSPCDRIRPRRLLGERKPRQRVLTDAELRAFWNATGKMAYPFGPLYRLLLLTGCRKNEIGAAQWGEIGGKLLTIPPERFKSDAPHLVPLVDAAMALIEQLPRFNKGNYLFSTCFGKRPIASGQKAKERLDKLMTEELDGEKLRPFVIHDLRRTVRTRLASLKVPDLVAEMVIGHGKKGLRRVYDQHEYLEEMREALEKWAEKLREIITQQPSNVVAPKRASA